MDDARGLPRLPLGEEIANAVTHGLGAGLGIAGLVILVVVAALHGSARHVVAAAIYGSSLVLLYLASTLYHALPFGRAKRVFQVFDHAAIFLLIAGTYTPYTLVTLQGPWGWSVFGVIWGLAATGIVFESLFLGRYAKVSLGLYLAMGWVILVAIVPLVHRLSWGGLAWLVGGGLLYTAGTVFYAWERLRFAHAVWHLFVLAGSVCHWFGVLWTVIPGARQAGS